MMQEISLQESLVSSRRRFLMTGISCLGLASCSILPMDGPSPVAIGAGASASLPSADSTSFPYALVDLSRAVLDLLGDPGPGSLMRSFGKGHRGPEEIKVGVGDSVQITVFESAAGGLFIPNDAGARPGNYVQLPVQIVDYKGYLTVPYAGPILAKGRSLPEIQKDIEKKITGRAIEPQVVVALVAQTSSQVTVIGQVGAANKVNINPAGDRILDVIAKAAGIANPGYESFVTLERKGVTATVYFMNIVTNPKENVYVSPGDVIYVYQQKRYFTAFGATGQSNQFPFDQEHLTFADAVGKAGGLLDSRANPGQVLVYRIENRETLKKLNVDLSSFPAERKDIPTIYRANFRDPSSFFVARSLQMQDKDVVYVGTADEVELTKFLALVATVTGNVSTAATDVVSIRKTVRR